MGVYSYFRDYHVTTESGIAAPEALVGSFVQPLSVYLDGLGSITHVINDHGGATGYGLNGTSYYC